MSKDKTTGRRSEEGEVHSVLKKKSPVQAISSVRGDQIVTLFDNGSEEITDPSKTEKEVRIKLPNGKFYILTINIEILQGLREGTNVPYVIRPYEDQCLYRIIFGDYGWEVVHHASKLEQWLQREWKNANNL